MMYGAFSAKHPGRRGAALAAVLPLALLAGCQPASSQPERHMPPPEVAVVTVQPRTVPVTFEYTGRVAGSREVEVRARVTGILMSRNYEEGSAVTAGQSLFTIDPAPFEAALARARADLASAQARLEQARRTAKRLSSLREAKAVSQGDHDDAVSAVAIAEADLQAARARLTEAQLGLDYTRVESPVSGVAGRALRSEGNYVSGPDVLLTRVTQVDPIYVLFGISDDERLQLLQEVQAGRLVLPESSEYKVSVRLAEGGIYANSGKLNFTDVHISSATGTSEARAELANPDGLLRPGQFVRVILKGARRPAATLVPQRAVLEGPMGKFVYVVDDQGTAQARAVEVGDWYQDEWIINAGLDAGDRVIVDGVMKIGPGAPVSVASVDAPPPGAGTDTASAH